jgi:type I restriction enzyme R subunit
VVGHEPHLAPGEPAAERDSFSEVVLVGRLREAIRRLKPGARSAAITRAVSSTSGTSKSRRATA